MTQQERTPTKEEAIAKARELVDAAEKNDEMSLVVFAHGPAQTEGKSMRKLVLFASPRACAILVDSLMENPAVRQVIGINTLMTCIADENRVEAVDEGEGK